MPVSPNLTDPAYTYPYTPPYNLFCPRCQREVAVYIDLGEGKQEETHCSRCHGVIARGRTLAGGLVVHKGLEAIHSDD